MLAGGLDLVQEEDLAHLGSLDAGWCGAKERPLGDAWAWSRKTSARLIFRRWWRRRWRVRRLALLVGSGDLLDGLRRWLAFGSSPGGWSGRCSTR